MNFAHCLHIILVIGKHTQVFRGIFFWRGKSEGGGYVEGSLHERYFSWGKGIFHKGGARLPSINEKNDEKLNKKQVFSTESKEQY